jgi:hypothetical protein
MPLDRSRSPRDRSTPPVPEPVFARPLTPDGHWRGRAALWCTEHRVEYSRARSAQIRGPSIQLVGLAHPATRSSPSAPPLNWRSRCGPTTIPHSHRSVTASITNNGPGGMCGFSGMWLDSPYESAFTREPGARSNRGSAIAISNASAATNTTLPSAQAPYNITDASSLPSSATDVTVARAGPSMRC